MRIGITYDLKADLPLSADLPDDFQEEFDSPTTVEAVAEVLRGLGHEVDLLGDGRPLLERLLADPPEFVFNFAEGHGIARSREARVPAVLEMLGIPYSGSDPLTLAATLDKDCAKRLVASAGVAVPRGCVVLPGDDLDSLRWAPSLPFPAIVKPAWEGSSKGIRGKCVVDSPDELADAAGILLAQRQPVLVEEFVPGEELTVGIVGNDPPEVVGILRVLPRQATERFVYSLEVKRDWRRLVSYECPARLPADWLGAVEEAALRAYRVLGCRDVSRVDLRLRDGMPYFLEVNPLPGLNPETSDLVILARLAGWSYEKLIGSILNAALHRQGIAPGRGRQVAAGHNLVPSRPTVMVLYNEPVLPADHVEAASENEVLTTAKVVGGVLAEAGFDVTCLGVGADPQRLLTGMRAARPDVVFNLFEGLATDGGTEATVAGFLEWLGLPFTGSPAAALTLAHDKVRTKRLLQAAGLPTPEFFLVDNLPCPACRLAWPAIVKPALQDASVGIEQASVVTDQEQLDQRVAYILERYGPPVLVEQFIRGREFHATLVEEEGPERSGRCPVLLPLAEIVFLDERLTSWPIYSYDAKWKMDGREYQMTPLRSPVTLEKELTGRLDEMAREAFRLVGCRDYARIDVRMTPGGQFFILEVNPNPFINSAGVINGLKALGRTHAEFLVGLVEAALRRGQGREETKAARKRRPPTM
jgi:D-alanine-D-alanine ligase